jgi:DNA polymerase-1
LIYVAGGRRMNFEYPELSIEEWEEAIEDFMKKYPGIRRWHESCENTMRATGVAIDVFGRRRRILKRDLKMHYKHCLNQFVNFPVQSSACTLIELSMVRMREQWIKEGIWEEDVFLTNFVHDELCFEVREDKLDYILPTIRDKMENTVKFKVPLRTEVKVVNSWMEAKL